MQALVEAVAAHGLSQALSRTRTPLVVLFDGPPAHGKSDMAASIAALIAGDPFSGENYLRLECGADVDEHALDAFLARQDGRTGVVQLHVGGMFLG